MRRGLLVPILVGLAAGAGWTADSRDAREAHRALLAAVEPRDGVQHRRLVVVPLVLRAATERTQPSVSVEGLGGAPVEGSKDGQVRLGWPQAEAAPSAPVLLPSGCVFRAGEDEHLLQRPTLLLPGTQVTLRTAPLAAAAGGPSSAPGTWGSIAPPEFRHAWFLAQKPAALAELLELEAALAGMDPAKSRPALRALETAGAWKERVAAAGRAVRGLIPAYGGQTVGHAAFVGGALAQLVLAACPATYAGYVKQSAEALGVSLVVWEALYARDDDVQKPARWPAYVAAVAKVMKHLGSASFKREPRRDEVGARGSLWRVRATQSVKSGQPPDVGWLVLDDEAAPVWFEAWPEGAPLPPPSPDFDGPRHKGAGSDDAIKQGAATRYFLRRFCARFPWRRPPAWLDRLDG